MPEFLSPIWTNIGAGGLVVLFVLSMFFNVVYGKRTVDKLMDLQEKRVEDKDEVIEELRKTNRAYDTRNDMLAEQVRQLIEIGRTANATIAALPISPERESNEEFTKNIQN